METYTQKTTLRLHDWIVEKKPIPQTTKSNTQDLYINQAFDPKSYVTNGWCGESLISKSGLKLSKMLSQLTEDTYSQFEKQHSLFNRSLKLEIFNEFLSYSEERTNDLGDICNYQVLFHHFANPESLYVDQLDEFKRLYSQRIATIYLLKIRFIIKICHALQQTVQETYLRNPNSYFTKIFKKGSSTELSCKAFYSNHYSWFRPTVRIDDIEFILLETSLTEIYKVFSVALDSTNTKFSHSLSQEHFGAFLIQLITGLPKWIGRENTPAQRFNSLVQANEHKVLSTYFSGDFLESISLSHWLAQRKIKLSRKKKYIIAPDFNGEGNIQTYMRLSYELQFLSLLTDVATRSELNPITLICETYRSKNKGDHEARPQQNLFSNNFVNDADTLYDRVVLNLNKFPKNNPHHYLIQQIAFHKDKLKSNGMLFVMSTKKLFVPSLTDKVEELLKTFRLESVLTFENLKGRGELAPYMYILSKRTDLEKRKLSLPGQLLVGQINQSEQSNQKHSCLNFRFAGDLSNFAKIQILHNGIKHFIRSKSFDSTPMYQKDLIDGFTMEYYQDAFVDGHLINTSSKDKNKITHPSFFKKLMNSCIPLSHFFQIESLIDFQQDTRNNFNSQNLLGLNFETEEQYPFVLVLDYRNKTRPRLEFIASSSYSSKKELYGNALCAYFGLVPKVKGININLFRYFFQTQLGNQIIQMSIRGNFNKLKAKLSSLLIPTFFEEVIFMPEHLDKSLFVLHKNANEIATYGAKELSADFEELKNAISKLGKKYPWHIISLLQQFNQQFENIIDYELSEKCIFENKKVIETLINDACHSLTENPEVFIKTENHFNEENLILERLEKVKEGSNTKLSLHNSEGPVLSLYSEDSMIDFLEFLFTNAKGVGINDLISYTKIPSLSTLKQVTEQQLSMNDCLLNLQNQTQSLMTAIINQQIYQSPIH